MTKQWKNGLPPVGELCECRPKGHKNAPFYRITIDYIGKTVFVATTVAAGHEIYRKIAAFEFRPISTEQNEKQALTKILVNEGYCSCEWLVDFILERESKLKDEIAELKADKQAIMRLSTGWDGYGEVEYTMANINAIASKHIEKENEL